jgi:hypothetical protein
LVPLKVNLADCIEFGFIALLLELGGLAAEVLELLSALWYTRLSLADLVN